MPHPRATELAADRITDILHNLDRRLLQAAQAGDPLPDVAATIRRITPLVETAIRAAFEDIAPTDDDDPGLEFYIAATLEQVATYIGRAIRDHQRLADSIDTAAATVDEDETRSATALARAGQLGAALIVAQRGQRSRLNRLQVARLSREARQPAPRQSAGRSRVAVRTLAAEGRNLHAANVADRRGEEWAIYVQDARLGPTDEPCERVDGQWATTTWLRNHPTEHPNCTRRGRPRRLPDGVFPTLLA